MKKFALACLLTIVGLFPAQAQIGPTLGLAEGRCRANEPGPAFLVSIVGLKDRTGKLKAELYPGNDPDFLQDAKILTKEGKLFHRVVIDIPRSGPVQICIRAPSPGVYGLFALHDRDGNLKFNISNDGVALGTNPDRLGPSKPRFALGRVVAGARITSVTMRMMYRRGLFSFAPVATP